MTDSSLNRTRSKAELKRLERLHILRTLANYGPMSGLRIVEIANAECDADVFDDLPELTNRGITAKLQGMWHAGLVEGAWPGDGSPMAWSLTALGENAARAMVI